MLEAETKLSQASAGRNWASNALPLRWVHLLRIRGLLRDSFSPFFPSQQKSEDQKSAWFLPSHFEVSYVLVRLRRFFVISPHFQRLSIIFRRDREEGRSRDKGRSYFEKPVERDDGGNNDKQRKESTSKFIQGISKQYAQVSLQAFYAGQSGCIGAGHPA